MESKDFSAAMEKAFKDALEQADLIIAHAAQIREEAFRELDKAKEIASKAEQEADLLLANYFNGKQLQFREAARTELLRTLTRQHLENGIPAQEISNWLDWPLSYIEQIEVLLLRLKHQHKDCIQLGGNPTLQYSSLGRGGNICFQNDQTRFELWWEFAWGDALLIVDIPTELDWEKRTHISLAERQNTLVFIGEHVIKDQLAGNGSFIIGEQVMTFYPRN
ncbi:hypothetical protein [Flavihumibacter fluvii]|uniref:hypothetical protein n=1 Tax=Flavihumibacter fluvii TaxID=2838157 RepID=UPI001BDDEA4F|nr:hypothetical protein [Flavihumibacter fluvii]ULQ53605.1 hypothetical protein KJS93_04630 [Flavihumibacter fluvii]